MSERKTLYSECLFYRTLNIIIVLCTCDTLDDSLRFPYNMYIPTEMYGYAYNDIIVHGYRKCDSGETRSPPGYYNIIVIHIHYWIVEVSPPPPSRVNDTSSRKSIDLSDGKKSICFKPKAFRTPVI